MVVASGILLLILACFQWKTAAWVHIPTSALRCSKKWTKSDSKSQISFQFVSKLSCTSTDINESKPSEESNTTQNIQEEDVPENDENENDIINEKGKESSEQVNATTSIEPPKDPKQIAIENYEAQLAKEVSSLESALRLERIQLSSLREKIAVGGKSGYFLVQAQVHDFQKKKAEELKELVQKNKREFIDKVLPIIDSLKETPQIIPATTDQEQNIHNIFCSLANNILVTLEKYGYSEIIAEEGEKLAPSMHQIVGTEVAETAGLIIRTVRPGFVSKDGDVVRKASVIATVTDSADESQSTTEESNSGKNDEAEGQAEDDVVEPDRDVLEEENE